MKVRELIELLQAMDPDSKVQVNAIDRSAGRFDPPYQPQTVDSVHQVGIGCTAKVVLHLENEVAVLPFSNRTESRLVGGAR